LALQWFLIFDTETTGLPLRNDAPLEDLENWPRLVQLAWQVHDLNGKLVHSKDFTIKPEGFTIPYSAEKVHGISTKKALEEGFPLTEVLETFATDLENSRLLIAHNIDFDINIVAAEYLRTGIANLFLEKDKLCTKIESTEFCALPGGRGGKFKWPNLAQLYQKLFNESFKNAHNASADVEATARAFLELARLGVIRENKLNISLLKNIVNFSRIIRT
jgi:DNA polymerase-3 subunit alpha